MELRTQILALFSETAPSIGPCEIEGVSLQATVRAMQTIAGTKNRVVIFMISFLLRL
jgi:hypothetical protein